MRTFTVSTEGENRLGLRELCQAKQHRLNPESIQSSPDRPLNDSARSSRRLVRIPLHTPDSSRRRIPKRGLGTGLDALRLYDA